LRYSLNHCSLADAGLSNQTGIVGPPLPQYVNDLLNLAVTPNHWIQPALVRQQREISPERTEQGKRLGIEGWPAGGISGGLFFSLGLFEQLTKVPDGRGSRGGGGCD
jgi:hypothetical protein